MAESLAQDPNVRQFQEKMAAAQGGNTGPDPQEYVHMLENVMKNSDFMNVAQKIGQQMMEVHLFTLIS